MPADLQHFKKLTIGHTLIMGRKTYDSISRPLPGRSTIVLSRTADKSSVPEEVYLTNDLQKATDLAATLTSMEQDQVFVAGGGEIYQLSVPIADRIYLTRVHTTVDGDAYFPEIDLSCWNLVSNDFHQANEKNEHSYTYEVYERIST